MQTQEGKTDIVKEKTNVGAIRFFTLQISAPMNHDGSSQKVSAGTVRKTCMRTSLMLYKAGKM